MDVYVGRRLRQRRQLLKMSQEQLARAIGVTFQQIQKYERGANRISASRLYDIAQVMGVPINFFFDFIEEEIEEREGPRGLGQPTEPAPHDDRSTHPESIMLVTAYWRLPSDDIRRKSLSLLRSMSGLKDKKGEPLPDDDDLPDLEGVD
ncbi:helix-turn-helix transcriptional regulator [Roseospira goensis]|uniref:Transcriptional regulator with XRE-family HTH domain n=1 Tax=Roseospira goensis TaxID=391922 RepID=A0A7W6WJS3_9PROT|nr:transcriptional regulator with XRE-family HTH domain [Roseospira goensis]